MNPIRARKMKVGPLKFSVQQPIIVLLATCTGCRRFQAVERAVAFVEEREQMTSASRVATSFHAKSCGCDISATSFESATELTKILCMDPPSSSFTRHQPNLCVHPG